MNLISKAINEISYRIPKQILNATFLSVTPGFYIGNASVEEQIMALVVRPRILIDLNLSGGEEVPIDLARVPCEEIQPHVRVYSIPKSLTNGRSIIAPLNVTYSDPTHASTYASRSFNGNSALLRAGQAVVDAAAPIPVTSSHQVTLIGENVVMVRDIMIANTTLYLRCLVEYDTNLSSINPTSYPYFCTLFEYAVKSYIWNNMIIRIDQNEIYAGQALGVFKNIVDGYADCESMYQTYLNDTIAKVLYMNDQTRYNRLIKLVLGGNK